MTYCTNYCFQGRAASQPFPYSLVSRAAVLPVSLAEAKKQLNIDASFTDDDDFITSLINASIDKFEEYTNTTLIEATFLTTRNCWEARIELKRRPLISVDEVKYNDENDAEQTVDSADYRAIDVYPWGFLYFNDTFDSPTIADFPGQISITFTAGLFDDAAKVPEGLKNGLLQYIALLYNDRGDCATENKIACLPCISKTAFNKYRIIEI